MNTIDKMTVEEYRILKALAKTRDVEMCEGWVEDDLKENPYISVGGTCEIERAMSFNIAIKKLLKILIIKPFESITIKVIVILKKIWMILKKDL